MISFIENENGKQLKIDGSYEEQKMCLRGILVSMSEVFGITFDELLEYAFMSRKEKGVEIHSLDVVFHFLNGSTDVKHLSDIQKESVMKMLGVKILDNELICADDFFINR